MILFVNACVRDNSRTMMLARRLLGRLSGDVEQVDLAGLIFPVTDQAFLQRRDRLIAEGRFDSPEFAEARRFACADTIVIAAPYYDLSFPASLKQYIEMINVIGITFGYTSEGVRIGLCRAKRLYYLTTAGGMIESDEYGFGYLRALASGFYDIKEIFQVKAEGLDLYGADTDAVMRNAMREADMLPV